MIPDTHRLFFALMPDLVTRSQLAIIATELAIAPRKQVRVENLHLTLVFLGNVDNSGITCLTQAVADIRWEPFTMQIDRCGWWKSPGIVWLGPGQIPTPLLSLQKAITRQVVACGITIESRSYLPHITLARKLQNFAPRKIAPISWNIADFCLVESVTRVGYVEYQIIQRWTLT